VLGVSLDESDGSRLTEGLLEGGALGPMLSEGVLLGKIDTDGVVLWVICMVTLFINSTKSSRRVDKSSLGKFHVHAPPKHAILNIQSTACSSDHSSTIVSLSIPFHVIPLLNNDVSTKSTNKRDLLIS
jgi:hypothetical protein